MLERRYLKAARLLLAMTSYAPPLARRVVCAPSEGKDERNARLSGRLYRPAAGRVRGSLLLVHGLNVLTIEDPRLIRFSTAIAALGYEVYTPQVPELGHYSVTASALDRLRSHIIHHARTNAGLAPIGLVGFSFAGGLALAAASDERVSSHLAYVASIGGYHDLARTMRYAATGVVEGPGGARARGTNPYSELALVCAALPYLCEEPTSALRGSLQSLMDGEAERARELASALGTPDGRRIFELASRGELASLRPMLLRLIESRSAELERVSPRGRLSGIKSRVLMLHGAYDDMIPPEETILAEAELRADHCANYHVLVTPALGHVDVANSPNPGELVRLTGLVARLL